MPPASYGLSSRQRSPQNNRVLNIAAWVFLRYRELEPISFTALWSNSTLGFCSPLPPAMDSARGKGARKTTAAAIRGPSHSQPFETVSVLLVQLHAGFLSELMAISPGALPAAAQSQFHKIARRGPRQLIAIYAQAQSQFDKIARPRSGAVPAPSS